MTRILFVDDEPAVLAGLRRSLHAQRAEWDMNFASGAREALQMIEVAPFDVVVSDMRMPGLDGAALLAEVSVRHPETIRFILSGYADGDLVRKCMGVAHQYLSKPCETEALKAAIRRAAGVEARERKHAIMRLVGGMDFLPVVPTVYSELIETLQNPEAGIEEVGAIVARDVSTTAAVLKLTNSAFFGLPQKMTSAVEATTYLGVDAIRDIVLSLKVFEQFNDIDASPIDLGRLWHHSNEVASTARAIARSETADRKVCDACFLGGMLHDVGKLVFAANAPQQYDEAVRLAEATNIEQHAAEEAIFGANHADVGGFLLGLWGLPVSVVEAMAFHHQPNLSLECAFSPLAAVHVAEAILERDRESTGQPDKEAMDVDYLDRLGIANRVNAWEETVDEIIGDSSYHERKNTLC